MTEKNFDIFLDLGSSKIRGTAFNKHNKDQNFFIEKNCISSFKSGQINLLEAEKNIENIILELEKKTEEYIDNVFIMLDVQEGLSINLSLSKKKDGEKISAEDIQYLIQDAKQQILKFNPEKNIIHIIVKNYKVDDKDYNYPPLEIACNLFSIDIIFICFPKTIIKSLENLFFKFQLSINKIFCSSYTKSLNYKEQFTKSEKIAFIDIGYEKTSIVIYYNNKLNSFNVLPVGGNHITKDISKILSLPNEESEDIKRSLNKNISFNEENKSSKIFKDDFLNQTKHKKETLELAQKIISARIDEILNLGLDVIKLNENFVDVNKFRIVLIGDGSKILDNNSIYVNDLEYDVEEILFFPEKVTTICESGLILVKGNNKQEVVMIPKKKKTTGFFEKLFHFFK